MPKYLVPFTIIIKDCSIIHADSEEDAIEMNEKTVFHRLKPSEFAYCESILKTGKVTLMEDFNINNFPKHEL
jgi:hypothetical protein